MVIDTTKGWCFRLPLLSHTPTPTPTPFPRTNKPDAFALFHVPVDVLEHLLALERHCNVFQSHPAADAAVVPRPPRLLLLCFHLCSSCCSSGDAITDQAAVWGGAYVVCTATEREGHTRHATLSTTFFVLQVWVCALPWGAHRCATLQCVVAWA